MNSKGLQEWDLKYQYKDSSGKIHEVWVVTMGKDLRDCMKNAKSVFKLSKARVKFTMAKRLR